MNATIEEIIKLTTTARLLTDLKNNPDTTIGTK